MATKPNKPSAKPRNKRPAKKPSARSTSWLAKLWALTWKLALLASIVVLFYVVYLDAMLSKRFAETRYQAPALLYSRALVIDPQAAAAVSYQEVLRELTALDYRQSRYARNPGEFQAQGDDILLFRRAFDFPDRLEEGIRVRLRFDAQGYLRELEQWPQQTPLNSLRLEPQLIGRFASDNNEDRLLVGLEQVPVLLRDTLLLVEDQDFYHHYGVKPTAIARAALANIAARRTVQGGSTITQQLIKNMYLSHEQTMRRKAVEALMALVLDYRFSKDEILEAYLNEVYFGQDGGHAIHGIGLASQFFYGKAPEDLNPAEIAMLVGMVQGPALFNPYRNPQRATARRDLVLQLMYNHDLINQPQYLAAVAAPIVTRSSNRLVARDRADYIDFVQRELRSLVPGRAWQDTGLRVFTYFDPWLQSVTEQAVRERMSELPDIAVQAAAVVSDYHTGTLRALVGGRAPLQGGFNRAFQARRPIGSLIKPFVYSEALAQPELYSLASIVLDEPLQLRNERGQAWQPSNFDNEFLGAIPLYQSWLDSRNVPAVQTALAVTPSRIRDRLLQMGATGAIHAYPSLALGTVDFSPVQLNQLYGFLANQGAGYQLSSIAGITTHRGELVYLDQRTAEQVYAPEVAYLAKYASVGVVEYGTARSLGRQFSGLLGGKTGSTNDLRDSWLVSFDGQYVLTVWLGRDDNQPIGLTGSRGALPVAVNFWQTAGVRSIDLTPPASVAMYPWHAGTGEWLAEPCFTAVARRGAALPEHVRLPGWVLPSYTNVDCAAHLARFQAVEPAPEGRSDGNDAEPPRGWWRRWFGSN